MPRPATGLRTALVVSVAVILGGLYIALVASPETSLLGWTLVSVGGLAMLANLALRDHLR
ncbi:MAG: hypothetical protein AB7J32_10715 [Pseudonocardia sp.]